MAPTTPARADPPSIQDGLNVGTRTSLPSRHWATRITQWRKERPRPAVISPSGIVVDQRSLGSNTGTGLLHAAVAAVCETRDAVVWLMGEPSTLRLWADQNPVTEAPTAIDWIAPTPETAMIMLGDAIDRIAARRAALRETAVAVLPTGDGYTKCHPNGRINPPAIVIVADLTGWEPDPDLISRLSLVFRTGRCVQVTVLMAVDRVTYDPRPAVIRQTAQIRLAGQLAPNDEYGYLFGIPWNLNVKAPKTVRAGTLLAQDSPGGPVDVVQVRRLNVGQIRDTALASCRHPALLEPSKPGSEYRQRWIHPHIVRFLTVPAGS